MPANETLLACQPPTAVRREPTVTGGCSGTTWRRPAHVGFWVREVAGEGR